MAWQIAGLPEQQGDDDEELEITYAASAGGSSSSSSGPRISSSTQRHGCTAPSPGAFDAILERGGPRGQTNTSGVHAFLLVPMRCQEAEMLAARKSHLGAAVLAKTRSWVLRGASPEHWRGHGLEQAMMRLKADRELVLRVVSTKGTSLRRARSELREDREVVLAAVCKSGKALEFASPRLQKDREVVLAALAAPGGHKAIGFVSQQLQADECVRRAALEAGARQRQIAARGRAGDTEIRPSGMMLVQQRSLGRTERIETLSDDVLCLLHF